MPEINLLQNQLKDTTLVAKHRTQLVVVISAVVLVLLIGLGAMLYFLTQSTQTNTAQLIEDNNKLSREINEQDRNLTEAKIYQAKLSNLELLLSNHVAISPLMDELERHTFHGAKFISLDVAQEIGKVHAEGLVASYENLGKLLLGLSTSSNFANVKLNTVAPTNELNQSGYIFSIDFNVTSNLFTLNNAND